MKFLIGFVAISLWAQAPVPGVIVNPGSGGGGGGGGTVTSVGTTGPILGGPFTTSGTISCRVATSGTSGCLSAADWNTFNDKPSTAAQIVPLVVQTGNVTPSSCTLQGQYFQNTADRLLSICNGSVYNSLSGVTYNLRNWGAKGDGVTDDTLAIQAWTAYVAFQQYGSAYVPAGTYMYNGPVIQWPSSVPIKGDGAQLTFLVQNHPTADLLMLLPFSNSNPTTNTYGPFVSDISFAGRGSATTGNLVDDLANGRSVFYHVGFWAHGGVGLYYASERGYFEDVHFTAVRTAFYASSNYSSNETYIKNFTAEDVGCARDAVVAGSTTDYNYNVNATAGTFPGSGSIRQDQNGAFDLSANQVNFHFLHGSIKSTHCVAGMLIRGGQNVSSSGVYIEGEVNGAIQPSIIYGGPHQKTTTSASLASGATTVELTDGYHFPHLSNASFFSNLQSGAPIDMLIRPPDFLAGGSAASSLGGSILRGSFEYVGFNAVLHDGTGSGWHGSLSSRGQAGTTALTWPAGAIFQDTFGDKTLGYATTADSLHLIDNHLNSVNTYTGYTVLSDTGAEQTTGEIVLGYEPDLFYVYGGPHSLDGELRSIQFSGNNRMLPVSVIGHNIQTFGYSLVDLKAQSGSYAPPPLDASATTIALEPLGSGVIATPASFVSVGFAGELDGIFNGYTNKLIGHHQGYSIQPEMGSLGAVFQTYPSLSIAGPLNADATPDWLWTFGTASSGAGVFKQRQWNHGSLAYVDQCGISAAGAFTGTCAASGGGVTSFNSRTGAVSPASADYSFSLISGSFTLAQFPTITNNTVLGNISGGTAVPTALSAANLSTILGLGTAATVNTGTSGATIPLNNGNLTLSGNDTFSAMLGINLNAAALPSPQTGTLLQLGNTDGTASRIECNAFGSNCFFSSLAYGGTNASRTALTSGTQIGGFNGWGYDGTTMVGPRAAIRTFANQNWSVGANGTYVDIMTTPNGSATQAEVMRFEHDAGVTVPATVTGGDIGAGTINAGGLYVNGVAALTSLALNSVGNPSATKNFAMGSNFLTFTFGATTGAAANMMTVQDTASNTGTGYVFTVGTASGSAAQPFQILVQGAQRALVTAAGAMTFKSENTQSGIFGNGNNNLNCGSSSCVLAAGSILTLSGSGFAVTGSGPANFYSGKATISTAGTVASNALVGIGTATFAPQTAAGTGATAVCATSHVCDSFSGEVTLTTGSVGTPATGSQLIVTFGTTRTNQPNCAVDVEGGTTFLGVTHSASTTALTISAGVALVFGTAYAVTYVCGGQ